MNNVIDMFEYKQNKQIEENKKYFRQIIENIRRKEEEANKVYTEVQIRNERILKKFKLGKYAND
ncbi:MAG: hypothetical protein ACK40T_02710 [Akkermansiaceae bacterium]|jgi:hypothetical protein